MADEKLSITIGHLYPDLLNLYGDRGNIIALERRCAWRGIDAKVVNLGAGEDADFESMDLFFIGGGQDFDQHSLLADLGVGREGSKADRLQRAIERDVPVLAICGGYQILGEYYIDQEGQQVTFIGALPMFTESGKKRLIGNIVYEADALEGDPVIVGFENHAGRTRLREGARALGTVISGFGNNGEDKTEGMRYRNVIATYSHGPLLPKNPQLADILIELALQRRHPDARLESLDDGLENLAHDAMKNKLIS